MLYATGLTGVIGRHIGAGVAALDFREFCKSGEIVRPGLDRPSTLVHLAGIVGSAMVDRDPREARRVNVEVLPDFITSLAKLGLRRFAYVSSGHVYGNCLTFAKEEYRVNPNSAYGEQKVEAENAVKQRCEDHGLEFTVLRGFSIIGPEMPLFSLAGALLDSVFNGSTIRFSDDVRDFMSPKSMAKALIRLAKSDRAYALEVVNVCTGLGFAIGDVARNFQAHFHPEAQAPQLAGGNSDFPRLVGSNARIKSILQDRAPQPPDWLRG